MIKNLRSSLIFLFFTLVYTIFLCFFYFKYVPLVKNFQIILIPILFVIFVLTAINIRWGSLFFIFAFPLINSLPYFFGIFGDIPHAPTALTLFLFFLLGWLVHNSFFRLGLSLKHLIYKPIILISILIVISGIITSLRYANFFPFLSDNIYELITNVNGVTAGGAIMSNVFGLLNYLTGFVLFFIFVNTSKSKEFVKRILILLLVSTLISIAFGFFQHFIDINLGNTPILANKAMVNATFKDSLSFGAYLAVLTPVLLSMIFAFKGLVRIFSSLGLISAVFILPYTGSKSGLIGMLISILFFLMFLLVIKINLKKSGSISVKKVVISVSVILLIIIIISTIFLSSKESALYKRFKKIKNTYKTEGLESILGIRWHNRWKMAAYMARDYPLSGVGIGAYIIELPNYAEISRTPLIKTDSAENYFLQVGSELGILALFFLLWIFLEIIKHIKKILKNYEYLNRWRYIQIGLSCGVISLLMIFFVHTFIGSYEIKYTFWLLVALIFCLGRSEKEPEEKLFFSRNFKIVGLVLIVLFGGVHLWNSTHSLSLKSRTEQFGLKQDFGLDKIEKTNDGREFRWTREYGGLTIKVGNPVIEIPLLASHPDIKENPVKVKIYLIKDFFKQKRLLDEIILTKNRWGTYEYHIPEEVNQEVILLFKVSRTWNPLKTLGTPDPRNLGVAVGKIRFKLKE